MKTLKAICAAQDNSTQGKLNEHNKLQEDSRILFTSQGCGGFFKGMVHDH
jgi:hypothetical protein